MGERRSWRSLGHQGGLLAGLGLAMVHGTEPVAEAAPICQMEGQCTAKKPLLLFAIDYSTAMNQEFAPGKTRWQAAVEAVTALVDDQNGYLQGVAILGVMRFGHDASPGIAGTKILGDTSQPPIIDGHSLDVPLYDANAPGKGYLHCNGEAIKAALASQKPPMDGAPKGIGAWTRGAIVRAEGYFEQAFADHPQDGSEREAALVVLTQGAWTDPSGTLVMKPPAEAPAPAAAGLYAGKKIATYVLAFGDAVGLAAADSLAQAGGTSAIAGDAVPLFSQALQQFVENAKVDVFPPICAPKMPRIMVLLDASSKMLNVAGGTVAGPMGQTSWDQARAVLAGDASIFDATVNLSLKLESAVYLGATVFGDAAPAPGEQEVIVDYGVCSQEAIRWSLDPATSCALPGCTDPWGGPPIEWTFKKDPELDCPGDVTKATSHMPRCAAGGPFPAACSGSGAQLHLGLLRVQENIAAYKAACGGPNAPQPCDAQTPFINILVTDGYDDSSDAQVQAPLEEMYAAGVTTYVLGVGEVLDPVRLESLAGWGSGGNEAFFADPDALQAALKGMIEAISFDPCCTFHGCGGVVECWDPDPKCGDGVVNDGEECDDGNNVPGDGCEPDCTVPVVGDPCGNGVVDPLEECDDGNTNVGDGCEPDCTLTPVCGDGKLQKSEDCDDGNTVPGDGCGADCRHEDFPRVCGDGLLAVGEVCDDGNIVPGDGCEPDCTLTPMDGSTGGAGTTTLVPTTGEGGSSSGGEGSSGEMVIGEDDGCGCAAEGSGARGGIAGLLALGLGRRRRRAGQSDSQT